MSASTPSPLIKQYGAPLDIVKLTSRIDAPNTEKEDDDIDLPPLEEDDGDGGHGCEWEFDSCFEKGTYKIATFISTDTGQPEYFNVCLRHFLIQLEYIADCIGDTMTTDDFYNGRELADYVFKQVLDWAHAADAPKEAIPVPQALLHEYLNRHVDINRYRAEIVAEKTDETDETDTTGESADDYEAEEDHPEIPRYIGYTSKIEDTIRAKIRSYMAENNLHLVGHARRAADERDAEWVESLFTDVFDPLLHSCSSMKDAVRLINECDLSIFDR